MLIASKGKEINQEINGKAGPVHILYSIDFGAKSTVTFSLSNGATATYSVDGSSATNPDELSGGTYIVSATYNGKTISRTINIPDIVSVSVTVDLAPKSME